MEESDMSVLPRTFEPELAMPWLESGCIYSEETTSHKVLFLLAGHVNQPINQPTS
jgi:hypothetical protein